MRHNILRSLRQGAQFKREFRREIRMLIVVTLGFTIAFTWRQTVFDISQSLIRLLTHAENISELSVLTSFFITIVSLLLVYITSHLLKHNPDAY